MQNWRANKMEISRDRVFNSSCVVSRKSDTYAIRSAGEPNAQLTQTSHPGIGEKSHNRSHVFRPAPRGKFLTVSF
jgi:hypothetical protein